MHSYCNRHIVDAAGAHDLIDRTTALVASEVAAQAAQDLPRAIWLATFRDALLLADRKPCIERKPTGKKQNRGKPHNARAK